MAERSKKTSRFPETHWSLVGRAGTETPEVRDEAVAQILEIYRPALRAFLVETRRIPDDLADDVLQDFFADKILAKRILERANRDRGRFRNFMVKSLSNYASNKLEREFRRRGRTMEFDENALDDFAPRQDTERFDQEWVRSLVTDALALMEQDCRDRDRMELWHVLRARAVDPILQGSEPVDYADLVVRFELETPRQAINLLATAKRAFMRHLRVAVGRYVAGPDRVDQEIEDLRLIVSR